MQLETGLPGAIAGTWNSEWPASSSVTVTPPAESSLPLRAFPLLTAPCERATTRKLTTRAVMAAARSRMADRPPATPSSSGRGSLATARSKTRATTRPSGRVMVGAGDRPVGAMLGGDEGGHVGDGEGTVEVIALHGVAAELPQSLELLGCLDPLGPHLDVELVGQADDRRHDGPALDLRGALGDQGLVDLEDVEVEALEVADGGLAPAEVVGGHPDPELLHGGEEIAVVLASQHPLGDLEHQALRVDLAGTDQLDEVVEEAGR